VNELIIVWEEIVEWSEVGLWFNRVRMVIEMASTVEQLCESSFTYMEMVHVALPLLMKAIELRIIKYFHWFHHTIIGLSRMVGFLRF